MAAAPVSKNPQTPSRSSSQKQKKAPNAQQQGAADAPNGVSNGVGNGSESNYLKELQKSLRNALKKLNATSKVDAILAENPGKELDTLVEEQKINPDQKAQVLKKPAVQANVAQLEEQIGHYKQFAASYEDRLVKQKTELEEAHKEELEASRKAAAEETAEANKKTFREQLLTLSKFLAAAATNRRSGDETSSETRAFEGVLYQVYGGSDEAVTSMLKLIEGVDENIISVEGEPLEVTYGKVKQASEQTITALETPAAEETAATTETAPASDPTLANAGLTETEATPLGGAAADAQGQPPAQPQTEEVAPPAQTIVSDAANPVAQSTWDPNASDAAATAPENLPRDPAETETGLQATPATVDIGSKNNPTAAQVSGTAGTPAAGTSAVKKQGGDGFEPVSHHQRQFSGRGRGRGRGRGDGFRGRGRGDFRGRGRGRGEFRGGRGRGGFEGQQGHGGSNAPAPAAAPTAPAAAQQ